MCHSENRYGDKQNKNRWDLQNVNTTWKIDVAINRIKTVGCLWTMVTSRETDAICSYI